MIWQKRQTTATGFILCTKKNCIKKCSQEKADTQQASIYQFIFRLVITLVFACVY